MTPLLLYSIVTNPFPLQASAESGNPNIAQLTIVATNNSGSDVTLQGMMVQIPIGQMSTQLTNDSADIGPVAPANWQKPQVQTPTGYVQYTYLPQPGYGTVKAGQSLDFVFNNIQVNSQTGTVEIDVTEGSNNCTPGVDCPVQKLFVTKFPNGWGNVSFWADPADIPADGDTAIYWNGPSAASYTLEYSTSGGLIMKIPLPGSDGVYPGENQPPLTLQQTTVFSLYVDESINGQSYHAQIQTTVTTVSPPPNITNFSGTIRQTPTGVMLVLDWQTDGKQCTITGNANILSPTYEGYEIVPTVDDPLLSQYTLTAINDVGQATSTMSIIWGLGGNTINAPYGIDCAACSADSTQIYAACHDGYLRVFDAVTLNQVQSLFLNHIVQSMAVSDDGSRLYMLTASGDIITADTLADPLTLLGEVTVTDYAVSQLVLDSAVSRVFVACNIAAVLAFEPTGDTTQPLKPAGSITIPSCDWVNWVAVSDDGSLLYAVAEVDNSSQGFIAVIDASKISIVGEPIGINGSPSFVILAAGGVFVACVNSDSTSTIFSFTFAGSKLVPASQFQIPGMVFGMGASADGEYLYVLSAGDDGNISVSAFSSVSFDGVGTPSVLGQPPEYVAPVLLPVSSDGTKVLVNPFSGSTLWILVPVSISGGQ
jgi:hypothetical protein